MGHKENLVTQRLIEEAEVRMQQQAHVRAEERRLREQQVPLVDAIEQELHRIANALTDKDWKERGLLSTFIPAVPKKRRFWSSIPVFFGLKQEEVEWEAVQRSEIATIELFSMGSVAGIARSDGLIYIKGDGRKGNPQDILLNYAPKILREILAHLREK